VAKRKRDDLVSRRVIDASESINACGARGGFNEFDASMSNCFDVLESFAGCSTMDSILPRTKLRQSIGR
jgi:hypothetical protein